MKTANKYDYLLKCSPEEINDLAQAACRVTKLIEQNRLDEANKAQFFAVMRTIIQRGDTSSYCCVNLLRDIKADELHGFLLDELRKDIFINEPLSIEIMKLLPRKGFPEYHDFLDSVKDEPSISLDFRNFINVVLDSAHGKRAANKYDYLLKYPLESANDLSQAALDITELVEQNQLDEADKAQFFDVMRTIIQRGDFSSYCCVNLLRDIMSDDMRDFLLDELRKDVFINEPLSIEIMKLLTGDNFPAYYDFLDSVKDEPSISSDFRNFINAILDFDQGKTKVLSFPSLYRKSRDSTDVEIKWS